MLEWPLGRAMPLGESWDTVRKGGANGIVMLLIAVSWWLAKANSAEMRGEAASIVEDLAFVLGEAVALGYKRVRAQDFGPIR